MSDHEPMIFPELIALQVHAYTAARLAMAKRHRAEELHREAHQLLADAEELERCARDLRDQTKADQ